jgi:hypothetical protein
VRPLIGSVELTVTRPPVYAVTLPFSTVSSSRPIRLPYS